MTTGGVSWPDDPPVRVARALLSVSDKTGIVDFAAGLARHGVEILSTGGTARALEEAGFAVVRVEDFTGFPEMLDGRVKTLHPAVHGGLLARRDDPGHRAAMAAHGVSPIDLVAIDLYPFERTVADGGDAPSCVENIDIGGPAMLRSAAKNHAFVAAVADPADYGAVIAALDASGGALGGALRRRLAQAAFARVAAYDAAVAAWFAERLDMPAPPRLTVAGSGGKPLRYGENPHQRAAFYSCESGERGVAGAGQVQGKALGYNNIADMDAALDLVLEFAEPAAAIVKHANPCGAACAPDPAAAWRAALACDPQSAFGGVAAFNRPLDEETARAVCALFMEAVVAPAADAAARRVFARRKNLRLLIAGGPASPAAPGRPMRSLRSVRGGLLAQEHDRRRIGPGDLRTVTRRAPTRRETADLVFAFRVCKHAKSNAVVFARGGATVGIGAGQPSRVDAARLGAFKAREAAAAAGESVSRAAGSVVASDAFFPFADGLAAAADAGATAVIQPGGSRRDDDVIALADARGLAMAFTGVRHFRH